MSRFDKTADRSRPERRRTSGVCRTALSLLAGACLTAGCYEQRVVRDGWAPLNALADRSNRLASSQGDHNAGRTPTAYTIHLGAYSGVGRHAQARATAQQINAATGGSQTWVQDNGQRVDLFYGRFRSANDRDAQGALESLRMLAIDDTLPFGQAQVVPIVGLAGESADPLDARQYTGFFTLQVGFYDEQFGDAFRAAAEQAVATLRNQGHEAYYYHGPHRSLVTIGLFTRADFVRRGNQDAYGPRITALQEAFPHNLSNGLTLVETLNGEPVGEQPSFLVRIF